MSKQAKDPDTLLHDSLFLELCVGFVVARHSRAPLAWQVCLHLCACERGRGANQAQVGQALLPTRELHRFYRFKSIAEAVITGLINDDEGGWLWNAEHRSKGK